MPAFSFELYPPRSADAAARLAVSLDHVAAAGPEFVSVTYGANGSSRDSSLAVLRELLARGIDPMAHLTCVGSTIEEESRVIARFLDAGITRFLALRGDPPAGSPAGHDFVGELRSAGELVQLIHCIHSEKEPYAQVDAPGAAGAKRLRHADPVTIAVAAFPNGHPRSRSMHQDIDTLLAKQAAGANLAITQLFFYADDYLHFVDAAREAGVGLRILPGIMPVRSIPQLHRIVEMTGEPLPTSLLRGLARRDDPGEQHAFGIAQASQLAAQVLHGGADGLHLYTFNQHEAVLQVLANVGMLPAAATPGALEPIKETA